MTRHRAKSERRRPKRGLTTREALFAGEYIIDLNATQAAIRAGYSQKTAYSQGQRLLKRVEVAEAVARAMEERTKRTRKDADWLLSRLAEEAEADIADLYEDDGSLKPVSEWPRIWRTGLVAGIEVEEIFEGSGADRVKVGEVKKLKLADRGKRLELIGRHVDVQAWKDRKEVSADEPLRELLKQIGGQAIRPAEEQG
jgi:phage terminase small subunit